MSIIKIAINEIMNFHYLDIVKRYPIVKYELKQSEIPSHGIKMFHKKMIEKNNFSGSEYSFSNDYTFCRILYHPIMANKYGTEEFFELQPGTELYEFSRAGYPDEWGLQLVTLKLFEHDEEYVVSKEELQTYSISVFKYPNKKEKLLMFSVDRYEKNLFGDFREINMFHLYDISNEWMESFIPLISYLKEFILMQDDYVYEHFIGNFIGILNDAKMMINSKISKTDKANLLKETVKVLQKLRDSINDVSKYKLPENLETCINRSYKCLEENEKLKQDEEEKKKLQFQQEKKEMEENKKRYLETIKAKSELLDYFNGISFSNEK